MGRSVVGVVVGLVIAGCGGDAGTVHEDAAPPDAGTSDAPPAADASPDAGSDGDAGEPPLPSLVCVDGFLSQDLGEPIVQALAARWAGGAPVGGALVLHHRRLSAAEPPARPPARAGLFFTWTEG